jgi:hypothetical protein
MPTTANNLARLIVYACPTGPLATQIEAFFARSRARFGPNSAHAYPPHITLTGFFDDQVEALPRYQTALAAAHAAAMPTRPPEPVVISKLLLSTTFHGLLIVSPWLETLTADFAARAVAPGRHDPLRLKSKLHLSLAYDFRPEHGPALAELAQALVQPQAAVSWELRFYQQQPTGAWVTHGVWPLA